MALSNIFKEPRREITESAVGLGVFGVFMYGDYHVALRMNPANGGELALAMFVTTLGIVASIGVIVLVLMGTHAAGDGICNWLARRGLELRPKNRPQAQRPLRRY